MGRNHAGERIAAPSRQRQGGGMITVGELAARTGVTPDTVRHYVRIKLLKPSRDPNNGYKLFSDEDVRRLCFIRQAKGLGFTLEDIAQIFADAEKGRSPCPRVREIFQQRIQENRQRLNELAALQERMETALQQWRGMPDGVPDGDSICHLIEAA